MKNLLLFTDNQEEKKNIKSLLKSSYSILEATNKEVSEDFLKKITPSISILLFIWSNSGSDLKIITEYSKKNPKIPILVVADNLSPVMEKNIIKIGSTEIISHTISSFMLKYRINNSIQLNQNMDLIENIKNSAKSGLYTREYFLSKAAGIKRLHPEKKYDIISAEIDNFKLVSTRFSGVFENKLLKVLGTELKKILIEKKSDGIFSYFGEGTFAYMGRRQNDYTVFCELLKKRLEQRMDIVSFSYKIGIYSIQNDDNDMQSAYNRANIAKNAVRSQYGEIFNVYNDEFLKQFIREQQIVESMNVAIKEKQFKAFLQPKVDSRTGKLIGAEALARWKHPEFGFIYPNEFIPVLEKQGFIPKLDFFILEEVCIFLKKLLDQEITPVPISVNFSRVDIIQEALLDKILVIIDGYKIPHYLIHVEITESAYIDNTNNLVNTIKNIHNAGFEIELDDFGTGFSSINMLNELPLKYLKLDMHFVQSELSLKNKRKIISFVISLAKWLNLHVIAEGVETEEQVKQLQQMDAYFIQGYFYSKPLPEADFLNFLLAKGVDDPYLIEHNAFTKNTRKEGSDVPYLLIVDDVELNRHILKNIFISDFNVVEAQNGKVALDYLSNTKDNVILILLDLVMPVMDGFTFMETIKKDSHLKDIPVIITSQDTEHSEVRAIKLGAEAFLPKPYNANIIKHNVKSIYEATQLRKEKKQIDENKKLLVEAYIDYLTGTLNQRGMKKTWMELPETCNGFFALYLLDIDSFKTYNDLNGHEQGDEILIDFINNLKENAGKQCIISRRGGDEFLLLSKDMKSAEDAFKEGQRLVKTSKISCSIGVTVFKEKPESMEQVEKIADKAMYKAKANGKNQCFIL